MIQRDDKYGTSTPGGDISDFRVNHHFDKCYFCTTLSVEGVVGGWGGGGEQITKW